MVQNILEEISVFCMREKCDSHENVQVCIIILNDKRNLNLYERNFKAYILS